MVVVRPPWVSRCCGAGAGFNYGSDGTVAEFPAVNCSVVVAHRQVNCTTTAGAGSDITWVLTIGNQTSQSPVTNYGFVCVA